jgi:adenine-specific DNA-methyltransferase
MQNAEAVEAETPNQQDELLGRLRYLVPEAFTEGRLDLEKLRALAGDAVESDPERFTFSWAGKRESIASLQVPSRATLAPLPSESVDFENAQHVLIEGENLEALKLLYRSYFGRVRLVYIDPPYNTGKDFIYSDDFSDPLEAYLVATGQKTASGDYATSRPEKNGRHHSSWLSMMYPRLVLARQLLSDEGAIFVSIDDNEVHNLRALLNEIFGEENFLATIIWQKVFSPKNTAKHFSDDHEYIVVYAKNADVWRPELLPRSAEAEARYENPDHDSRGDWTSGDLTARNYYSEGTYEVTSPSGKKFKATVGTYWRVKRQRFDALDADNRIWWGPKGDSMPRLKRFITDVKPGVVPQTLWKYETVGHTQDAKRELLEYVTYENTDNVLDTVKPTKLLQQILKIGTDSDASDIVLDFFAGSGTTGHAVLKQNREDGGNRRFVGVQFPEPLPVPESKLKTLADVGRMRVRTAIAKRNGEPQGDLALTTPGPPEGVRCFRLAESAMRRWRGVASPTPEAYEQELLAFMDPLLPGLAPEIVVWEIALREGYSLNSRIETIEVEGTSFWRVRDSDRDTAFYACLADEFPPEAVTKLGAPKNTLFVCRDQALSDTAAANLALQCRLRVI